jgi:hypothetical protein
MFEVGAKANPTCRSWEKTSAILSLGLADHIQREALWGQIGQGMTTTFEAFFRVEDKMPKWQDILAQPLTAPVFGNEEADVLYLLLANLVEVATEKNIEPMLKYIERLPNQEFMAMWVRDLCNRHPKFDQSRPVTQFKLTKLPKILV